MISEINTRTEYPYRAVTFLIATFPDGSQLSGTGALVGRNDVLTATHVIYSPDHGGWATSLEIYPGVDFNQRTYRFESSPVVELGAFRWTVQAWPEQTFQTGSNETLTTAESQYDIALIGLSQAVGDQVGWFGVASGYNDWQQAYQIGYPSDGTGMMLGTAWVDRNSLYSVYRADASTGSDIMAPGSSGGPLFILDELGDPYVIGVRSSGSATTSYWADVDLLYEQIVLAMGENDSLLPDAAPAVNVVYGTAAPDTLFATAGVDDVIAGAGLDTLLYDEQSGRFLVERSLEGYQVTNRLDSLDVDSLNGVERLTFTDGTLALDIGPGETAGSAYRLYQAAFDRTPDTEGLRFWVSVMDRGTSLMDVSAAFTTSPEYRQLYGAAPTDAEVLTHYYLNVLDRTPDQEGFDYWMTQMQAGLSDAAVLAYFSESPENRLNVIGAIEDGIWLGNTLVA
ncbi:DUF4214 domain-containing protein [Stutzerimonas urumqiensis]|uniref:DUF4214 domain-containing protein n=1 Tax=Stutzerimonas urumqiensis TaxID=638269 RepID=UPI000EB33107|nr:DUF4214 domain-containing protein [Stutzerimonas urumqiensis]